MKQFAIVPKCIRLIFVGSLFVSTVTSCADPADVTVRASSEVFVLPARPRVASRSGTARPGRRSAAG
jgi:hypothetical protein